MYLIFVRFSTFINSAVLWQNNINNNHFAALCLGLPGWVGTRSSLTHPPSWSPFNLCQLLPSTTIHSILPVQITCLAIFFAQPLSMSSLVYLLAWSPPPHIPYISSPNQCLLFATHAHIIATSFAVVSILYHLFLAFLLTPYLELYIYLNITHPSDHSHLCSLKTTSFSFLTGQVSLLCSILLRTPPNQWYIPIGKQWYQLREFIPFNLVSGLQSCISIYIHTQHISVVLCQNQRKNVADKVTG